MICDAEAVDGSLEDWDLHAHAWLMLRGSKVLKSATLPRQPW